MRSQLRNQFSRAGEFGPLWQSFPWRLMPPLIARRDGMDERLADRAAADNSN